MYLIPLIAIILLGLVAVAWSPIFALIVFAIFFVLFLGYVGLSRRADQEQPPGNPPHGAERGPHEPSDGAIR